MPTAHMLVACKQVVPETETDAKCHKLAKARICNRRVLSWDLTPTSTNLYIYIIVTTILTILLLA